MTPDEFDSLSRDQLIERAEALGVERASVLTRAELADEIVRRTVADPVERRAARGLLGVARDLLARVVERGLHLPEAAALIRGPLRTRPAWPRPKAPLATVTLAEIYAAQGHKARALLVLDEVLAKESDHTAARALRDRLALGPELAPVMPAESEEAEVEPAVGKSPVAESKPPERGARTEAAARPPGSPLIPGVMLDDAPLPDRYDVDEIVAMPVDPRTVYVYWEAREATLAEIRNRDRSAAGGAGTLLVRLVAVTPSWKGPVSEMRDLPSVDTVGDAFVRDLPKGAAIRVALGWSNGVSFEPIVIAPQLFSGFDAGASGITELARYGAGGMTRIGFGEPPEPALARALDRFQKRKDAAASQGNGLSTAGPSGASSSFGASSR